MLNMIKCPVCGTLVQEGEEYCPSCGYDLYCIDLDDDL